MFRGIIYKYTNKLKGKHRVYREDGTWYMSF